MAREVMLVGNPSGIDGISNHISWLYASTHKLILPEWLWSFYYTEENQIYVDNCSIFLLWYQQCCILKSRLAISVDDYGVRVRRSNDIQTKVETDMELNITLLECWTVSLTYDQPTAMSESTEICRVIWYSIQLRSASPLGVYRCFRHTNLIKVPVREK